MGFYTRKDKCPRRDIQTSGGSIVLKEHFDKFVDYILEKKYEIGHQKKLINYGRKLSKSIHFFNYREVLKIKTMLRQDAYYKAMRGLCNYFEELYLDDDSIVAEINKIRRVAKKPPCNADIYTPTDEEMFANLKKLKEMNVEIYKFYLGLMLSGVRIKEMAMYVNNSSQFRIIQNCKYYKVMLNSNRTTKKCYFIYLPLWYSLPPGISLKYLSKFLYENKEIIRPKYIRNWFYSKCMDLEIPTAVIDFYQGRSPVSVGSKHYLDKEKKGDKYYERIEMNFINFLNC